MVDGALVVVLLLFCSYIYIFIALPIFIVAMLLSVFIAVLMTAFLPNKQFVFELKFI